MSVMLRQKIVVLDDDPTGSQTVHGCQLLTRWHVDALMDAFTDDSPLMFVLTNTRGMSAVHAADITREVCRHVRTALAQLAERGLPIQPIMVSRSDSTLRGHYPVETDVINEELGPFDAHFLVPAFFEGGRITHHGTHYLLVKGERVPVHQTEFARDSVFGYSHSYLPDYVQEKTSGRIKSSEVKCLSTADLNAVLGTPLMMLQNNVCVAVDAETQADLNHFADHVRASADAGKRWLFRSGASLLTALSQLPPQPVAAERMHDYVRAGKPGVVIVGSHVRTTTVQLEQLLAEPTVEGIMIDVERIADQRDALLQHTLQAVASAFVHGKTSVVYTSRTEKTFADQLTRLAFGERVSALLMDVVRSLPEQIGFLISKGGITSNDVLSDGLALVSSRVLGQILAGCSVVRCPADHPRYPQLPVVIFPGNVGDEHALVTVYRRLSKAQ